MYKAFPQPLNVMSFLCNLFGFSAFLMSISNTTVLVLVSPTQSKIILLILLLSPKLSELLNTSINPSSSEHSHPLCRCELLLLFSLFSVLWPCLAVLKPYSLYGLCLCSYPEEREAVSIVVIYHPVICKFHHHGFLFTV